MISGQQPESDGHPTAEGRRIRIQMPDIDAILSSIETTPAPVRRRTVREILSHSRIKRFAMLCRQRLLTTFRRQYPFDVPPPGRSAIGRNRLEQEEKTSLADNQAYTGFTLLATGGEGRIDAACDQQLQRIIAVKSLKKERSGDTAARERFRREAILTARLNHPGIVPVYALYEDPDGSLHSVMKLIDGESLSNYLHHLAEIYRKAGVEYFDEGRALRERLIYFLQVCSAISFAHEEEKIIHRDIKSENVMLGRFDQVYVMDWGVACPIDENDAEGHVAQVMGTPSYLAPETLLEKVQNVKTDIYALGIMLYEIVFLKQAYPGAETKAVVRNILENHRHPPFHVCGVAVDRELKAIIAKASAYYAHERYNSVKELSDDLKNYLAGRETKAAPDSRLHRIVRWHRLHHHAAALTYTILLSAVLFLIGAFFYRMTAERSRRIGEARLLSETGARCSEEANKVELFFGKLQYMMKDFSNDADFLQRNPAGIKFSSPPDTLLKYRLNLLLRQCGEKQKMQPVLWITFIGENGKILQVPDNAPAETVPEPWYGSVKENPGKVLKIRCADERTGHLPSIRLAYQMPGRNSALSIMLSPRFLKLHANDIFDAGDPDTTRCFINRAGVVTTRIAAHDLVLTPPHRENASDAAPFQDQSLLQEIMKQKYGAIIRRDPDGTKIVAFSYLPNLDGWFVIVRNNPDFDKL